MKKVRFFSTGQKKCADQYRMLLESSIQGILVHQDFVIRFANPATARIFGYRRPEKLMGGDVRILVAPHERSRLEGYRTARLRQELAPSHYEWQGVCKDGALIWVESLISVVPWEGAPAVLITFLDITPRKQLEAQILQVQKMAALGTLAGGVAHDLNNLLAAILGYTELALHDIPQDQHVGHYLDEVLTAGTRASELAQKILSYSRHSAPEQRPLQLHTLVQEALALLRATLPSTIDIRPQLDQHAGAVLANATQMHQVLMNLCTNAAHAMRETGGVLEVRLEAVELLTEGAATRLGLQPGSYVQLTVRDTGHGMSPDILDHIFDPFFTTKDIGEGTGLGLTVVWSIVTSHGGGMHVESAPGQGTTFEIALPRIGSMVQHPLVQEEPLPGGHECILFIDDEPALARLGQMMLARLGYDVRVYTSSVTALEAFRAAPEQFDLVITDQTMPHMTGVALAQALRDIRSDMPIILCSGFSVDIRPDIAQTLGIKALLMKPLSTRNLALAIRRALT